MSFRPQREGGASCAITTSRFAQPVDVEGEIEAPRKSRTPKLDISTTLGTLVEPGEYRASVAFADYYFHRAWKRWTAILKFDLFDANLNRIARDIPMWFALGKGRTPRAGRGSKYLKLWFQANGANAPRRNRADRLLSPRVFERRMVRVLVVTKDVIPPYSAVSEILSWETGASEKKAPMKVSAPGRVEGKQLTQPHRREVITSLPQSHYTQLRCPDCKAVFSDADDFARHSVYDCAPCRWVD